MNLDTINNYVKMIMSNLSFKADYQKVINNTETPKLLIVEGTTDEKFIKRLINYDVRCMVANQVFSDPFKIGFKSKPEKINSKAAIVNVVYGLSRIPQLISCPGSSKWKVYGMVDLDLDDSESDQYMNTEQLFVTDTHDLETLLISTDDKLLKKVRKGILTDTEVNKAFYMAYQIGLIRKVLYDYSNKVSLSPIATGSNAVIFDDFISDYVISLNLLIHYINEHNEKKISNPEILNIIKKVKKDRRIKKYLDNENRWNRSLDDFSVSQYPDFWEIVNGHDILALLKYLNKEIAKAYLSRDFYLNREFEMDLIDNYDYKFLENTGIYNDMLSNQIVNKINLK